MKDVREFLDGHFIPLSSETKGIKIENRSLITFPSYCLQTHSLDSYSPLKQNLIQNRYIDYLVFFSKSFDMTFVYLLVIFFSFLNLDLQKLTKHRVSCLSHRPLVTISYGFQKNHLQDIRSFISSTSSFHRLGLLFNTSC